MAKLFSLFSSKEVHLIPGKKTIPASDFSKVLSAQEVIETAKEEVSSYKKEIAVEAEKTKERAFGEGFSEGLVSLNKHLLMIDEELKALRKEAHSKILPLALKAARKIIGEELKLHPDRIIDIVLTALRPVTQHRRVTIYLNREDLNIIEINRPKIKAIFEHLENLSLQERDDIEPGGCMIETEAGIINAQLENQWRALESAFESFKDK